jgi:hypothetical protein
MSARIPWSALYCKAVDVTQVINGRCWPVRDDLGLPPIVGKAVKGVTRLGRACELAALLPRNSAAPTMDADANRSVRP